MTPATDGFRFDTWARQRATVAHVYSEAWEEGFTDWDKPDLWKQRHESRGAPISSVMGAGRASRNQGTSAAAATSPTMNMPRLSTRTFRQCRGSALGVRGTAALASVMSASIVGVGPVEVDGGRASVAGASADDRQVHLLEALGQEGVD